MANDSFRMHIEIFEVPTHHHPHHLLVTDFFAREPTDVAPIAQGDNPVRQFLDLAEPVRDVDDTDTMGSQVFHNFYQAFGL